MSDIDDTQAVPVENEAAGEPVPADNSEPQIDGIGAADSNETAEGEGETEANGGVTDAA